MTDKIPCTECEKMILPATAAKTGGVCMPCSKIMNDGIDIHRNFPEMNFNQLVPPVVNMNMFSMVEKFISEFVVEHGKYPTFNQLPDEIKSDPGAAMIAKSQLMAASLYDDDEENDDDSEEENDYQKMTEDTVEEIKELMTSAALSNSEKVTIYLLYKEDKDANERDVTRCDGVPIGVSDESWPQHKGKPMEHLLTLDLDQMPALKKGVLENQRAISLFINDRMENEAFEEDNEDTSVMLLSNADIEQVVSPSGSAGKKIAIIPIDVPVDVFSTEESDIDEIIEIQGMLLDEVCAYVGGGPVWMQGDESNDNFLFQFDERLVDVNLGDSGVMYVFAKTAFWQCA